ncbi:ABC transporter permease [Rubripirellula amarantea]|uniref:Macrolide export ATP-binding/permease protein MacB n=1 Tax=Rubripirellula amarantea TaxID=2527999 RepID=A0A5C5WK08_9BACT|nr:ABC transporter permease [Rubripirellula amarantea]MDA8744627.1 ABC transporter permease [Rubripirellula amarantea]TWT51116.1 Macrolide export ATP-binding/permease protein MacB [Rubripirellula amarantea]
MKLLVYIWRNVTRNKLRSSLTILSVGFSLALMTILYGYLTMQSLVEAEADKYDRVVVLNKLGFASPLPIAHVTRIQSLDSVVTAMPFAWFGGNYENKQATFAQFAVDPDVAFDIYEEYEISDEHLQAFKSNRQAAVCNEQLAEDMGWKLGDRIPLQGMIFQIDLDLTLVGTYKTSGNFSAIWFDWEYADEEMKKKFYGYPMGAGSIYVKCADRDDVEGVCQEIDEMFANSENSTKTRTEAAFARMFADMLGDVQTYIRYISLAVVFALALVAATAMAMSMRERTTEVAVLKAIGFSKQRVLALVLGESTLIAAIGGLLGIAGGLGALHMLSQVPVAAALFPIAVSDLIGVWLVGLAAVAGAIGFVSGVVPAILAANLSVIDGLRRVV